VSALQHYLWWWLHNPHPERTHPLAELLEPLPHETWMDDAACATAAMADAWFPGSGRTSPNSDTAYALHLCQHVCPVRIECLNYALSELEQGTELLGIWGGTTARERRSLLKSKRDTHA
jgi:hypothetical protein